jgi:glutamate carboxypeptidase
MSINNIAETVEQRKDLWIEFLRDIVNIDSGTDYKEGVDFVGTYITEKLKDLGFDISIVKEEVYGNHILAYRNRGSKPRILFVGHMDTVYPRGTVKERPFLIRDNKAYGPGVLDMKGGIMVMFSALDALKETGSRIYKNASICVFLNSDEEILSPSSSQKMDDEAKQADLAIVFEPARPGGGYVRRRWSVARLRLVAQGISGHSGWISLGGRSASAVHELIYKLYMLLERLEKEGQVLINIGIIKGGDRFNVVAPYAEAELSLRAPTLEDVEKTINNISDIINRSIYEGAKSMFEIIVKWPSFLDNERNRFAIGYFQKAAQELGRELKVSDTGGASDGNHISQYTAVVDGAGAYGEHPHSPYEYIEIDKTFERAIIAARALEIFYEEYISHRNKLQGV